jgi:hypothetical protein
MALIKLNINNFKKDLGGIANRLIDRVADKIERKLENAVEDAFAKGLKKIGLSDNIAGELSARFGDAFSVGQADRFFGTSTAEQNRVSSRDCVDNILNRGAETVVDAQQSIKSKVQADEGLLQFPPDIGNEYYMMMKFTEYARPSPQQPAVRKGLRNFILPIPRELKEQFTNDVSPKGMGVLAGGLADIGTDIFRGGGGENAKGQLESLAYSVAVQKVGDLLENTGDLLAQFGGAVPNPHLQAIFSGVQLRTHSFQWTFSPRNAVESRQLQQIIYELKKYSLPAFSNLGTAALQYPPLVDIELQPWKDKNEDLIIFKPCIVQGVSVNYAPQGLPSFFRGTKQPTFIQVTIDFMETEIQTAYDYGTKKGDRNDQATKLYEELKATSAEQFPAITGAISEVADYGVKLIDTASSAAQRANQ